MNAIAIFNPKFDDPEIETIFEPVPYFFAEALHEQYNQVTNRMKSIHGEVTDTLSIAAMAHFFEASRDSFNRYAPKPEEIFNIEKALKSVTAKFWQKLLNQTSLYDLMPQARREEWNKSIEACDTPPFTLDAILSTLNHLYAMRPNFLAERVKGAYDGLSRNHVTNPAHGFYHRMIIENAAWTRHFYSLNGFASGLVSDLIHAIRVIETGDLTSTVSSHNVLDRAHKEAGFGEWTEIENTGVFVKFFKKGTVHVRVSEHQAWRLNCVLASTMPDAIPHEFRSRPRQQREEMFYSKTSVSKPAQAVFARLAKVAFFRHDSIYTAQLPLSRELQDKSVLNEISAVIEACGGAVSSGVISFDYDPEDVINELAIYAHIPGRQSHQYYPTPDWLAKKAVDYAKIEPHHRVLEPSAGQGALALAIDECASLDCVEISPLHCTIMKAKQLNATIYQADFLKFAASARASNTRYDRIVMNPPFAQSMYRYHIEAAADLLAQGGKLIAIVPAGARYKELVGNGFKQTLLVEHDNAFEKTGVSVALIKIEREEQE